jgi:SSS family solute:Na+ symporter
MGIPLWGGALIGAAIMTIYFAAGGLLGSAWVNSLQLVVMLGGFLFALPVVLENAGGFAAIAEGSGAPASYATFFHSSGPGSGWMFLVLTAPSFLISPGLIQKAYGAKSERALTLGIGLNAMVLMLFAFVPVIFGMAARTAVPHVVSPNDVLPAFLMTALPTWLGALALSAVFSTEVDTCDTILFMLSTSISKDVYKRHVNPSASDAQLLRVARLAAAAGGAAGVVLSLVVGTVLGAVTMFYQVKVVTFFVPIVGGLYVRRMTTRAAAASIAAGLLGLPAAWLVITPAFRWADPVLVGLFAACLGAAVASGFPPSPKASADPP